MQNTLSMLTRCTFIITRASIKTWESNFIFILKQSITILRLLLCFQALDFLLDVTSWQSEHSFSSTLLKIGLADKDERTQTHTHMHRWNQSERYKDIIYQNKLSHKGFSVSDWTLSVGKLNDSHCANSRAYEPPKARETIMRQVSFVH